MKNNVMKKMFAGILVSSMVLSMAACGEENVVEDDSTSVSTFAGSETNGSSTPVATSEPTPEPTQEPPVKITIALPSDTTHAEENREYNRLVAELNEYTGAEIEWVWLDQSSYYDSLPLKYISGDVEDVMVVGDNTLFTTAAEAGLFWDLAPYIDEYDNFATIPQAIRENASYNGKLYAIPRSRNLGRYGFGYRIDWLNNLGLAEPATWEAFEEMLYAFTYNDPDGNGVDDTVGMFLDQWTGAFDIMMTWFGVPNNWGIDANGDLIHESQTQEYKVALAEIRELYAKGCINNGTNGISDFQEVDGGKAAKEGLRTSIGGCGVQVLDDMRKVQTYFEGQGITTPEEIIFTLQGSVDTGLGTLTYPTQGYNGLFAVSTKNIKTEEQLRKVLDVLNSLSDGTAMNLMEYGWEGVTYGLDENGYVDLWMTEEDGLLAAGVENTSYRDGFNQIISYFTAPENARPITKAPASSPITIMETEIKAANEKTAVPDYGASYSSETYVMSNGALDAILSEAMLNYITGQIDEAGLDEQLKTWWTAGGEQVTKEMNELYHASKK